MMTLTFDLISDLHVDTWSEPFDWSNNVTSPYCLVVGDVATERKLVINTLQHLGSLYQAVFYIDGNSEHKNYLENLNGSYTALARQVNRIKNVVYIQDNVVVVDGIAIVGTNGWFGFDFDLGINAAQVQDWYQEKEAISSNSGDSIRRMANTDAQYLISSVQRLQSHHDVKKIVAVTHTVPRQELIAHDIELNGKCKFNIMGNRFMNGAIDADLQNKIHTWCFGHYHGDIDQIHNGIRYVNNPRGRGDTPYCNLAYHAKRISVTY